jgi:flagellar protein FlaF
MRGYGAYQRVQNIAEPPRAVERRLMGSVTAALIAARDAPHDLASKFDAILWNKRVWDSFIGEVTDEANRLPPELKSGIVRLGAWVTCETQMVMDGISTPDMLIEINQQIIEGLATAR